MFMCYHVTLCQHLYPRRMFDLLHAPNNVIVVPVFFVTEGERVTGAMGHCEDSSWTLIGYLWLLLASDWLTELHYCDTDQKKRRNSCVLDHNNDSVHFITMSSALVSRDIFVMS